MSLEIFARQSVAAFMHIYAEVYTGDAIKPEELEAIIWGRLCAKEAGISRMSIKMPYDNIRRSKVTLPYMPEHINYTGCPVIKKNGGLYTPCCTKVEKEALYCKTCMADKEGKPKEMEFGLLDDREQNIEDGNFAPITYAEWMKGHKTTLPEVYAKLAAQGIQIEIPAEELICRTLPKNRRGRKSKPEDEDEAEPVKPKRKPKAAEADAESSTEDEAPKPVPKKPPAKPTHKASPVASPEASDSESSDDEAPARGTSLDKVLKASPKASPVASPAVSDSEKPKAKVASKKATPATSDSDSKKGPAVRPSKEVKAPKEAKEAKEPKAKAEKPAKAQKAAKAEKAAKAPKEAKEPKVAKAPKAEKKTADPEPATAEEQPEEFEAEFERQHGDKVVDAGDGQDYIQRGEILFNMEGRIVGRVVTGEDGDDEVEWTDGRD